MKKINKLGILLLAMVLLFSAFCIGANAAKGRKSLGYKWSNKYSSVYFYCGFNNTWKDAISAGMSSWNAVKEISTNKTVVPMYFTSSSSSNNKIYSTSNQTWLGKMFPTASNGVLTAASIAFNSGDYSYTVGAASGKYDIQTIATHELGHAIGVAHCHEEGESPCFSPTCTSNVMKRTTAPNTTRRTLTDYDKASKQVIYK